MKTNRTKKLALNKESVRHLAAPELAAAHGGISGPRQCNYTQFTGCNSLAFSNCTACDTDICTF
jgi:hypothetical protein